MDTKAYFDCAASTPLDVDVFRAMEPYFSEEFGNPGSLHFKGQKAQAAVDRARQEIAGFLKTEFNHVLFFPSATEANNFALQGLVGNQKLKSGSPSKALPHLVVSKTEHSSVLETARYLEKSGQAEVSYPEIDKTGLVDPSQLKKLLKKETVLVSVMSVNNETGAIQPIKEISGILREFRAEKLRFQNQSKFRPQDLQYPIFHSDAVQGLGHLPLKDLVLADSGVDLMVFSGHKIYGPKGIGVLAINLASGLSNFFQPLVHGGAQEFGFHGGTENVPAIVGFAKAMSGAVRAAHNGAEVFEAADGAKKEIIKKAKASYPKTTVNSPAVRSVPEIVNLSFPGFSSEELIYRFDRLGIAVSAGSACGAKALQNSHVLSAMGLPEDIVGSAVRISFGRKTKKSEFDYLFQSFKKVLK